MLDQENGNVEGIPDPPYLMHQLGSLAGVHTGSGFIQQNHGRIGRQRPDDLQPALNAIGQASRLLVGMFRKPHEIQQLHGLLIGALFGLEVAGQVQNA